MVGGALTLYRVDSQGSVRTVLTDTPPAGGTAPYITDFAAAPGYAVVCLADGAGSCVLQIVDGQSGDISATIRPSVVDYTFAVSGNRLYLRNRNAGTMDVYALPSGEKADSFAIVPEAQEVAAYAVDGENQQIVFLTMDGVFQAGFGSSVKQAMVQEKGFVYAAPQTTDYEILPLGDAAFLVSCLQNGAPLTVLIRLDATLPTQAAQSLYIWALEDSDVIRSAAAVFANQYPDCDVQLEFGRDATSQALSDEDIIKNLNTRLLAGEAPDVLFLDGLPIRSLMEKGVLASLDGVVSMDGYYENILTAYSLDGRPYAYPSVFRVPVFVSGSSEINVDDYASLASLAALYQEQSLIFNTSYEDIFDSFYIASSAGLFPEEKRIDEDALRAFLQSTREMIDGQQITAQTNEYVMASGNGQSVAQSEFAMSLIKVAEGSYPCGTGVVSSRSDALKLFWSYPAVAIRPLPGSGFEAKEIVSIPANAANPTLAKAFVQIMLTDPVVQLNSLYKGFSVQRDVENAYLAQTIADGEQTYAADPLTCDWDSLIEELGAPSVSSATIYDVTHEAAFDYYGNEIALATAGTVGADLANLVNEAALRAVRKGRKLVIQEDLLAAFELVIAGAEKKGSVLSEFEKKLVAYHEVGHAMVAYRQKHAEPVSKITIVPHTQGALGYTLHLPEEDKHLHTRDELLAQITVSMGGRVAEELVLHTMTNGAAQDIQDATGIARNMVAMFGMSDEFGMMALASRRSQYLDGGYGIDCAQDTAAAMDRAVRDLIDACYKKAVEILSHSREDMDKVVEYLLEKETITGAEMVAILEGRDPALADNFPDPDGKGTVGPPAEPVSDPIPLSGGEPQPPNGGGMEFGPEGKPKE